MGFGPGCSNLLVITILSGHLLVRCPFSRSLETRQKLLDFNYGYTKITDQTFVFLSRSSLSLGLPPIPKRLLPLPAIIQFLVLSLLFLQAKTFFFSSPAYTPPAEGEGGGVDRSITIVFLLICLEGLCGGSGYVNTFYHVGREGSGGENDDYNDDNEMGGDQRASNATAMEKKAMEREFRIGAVGAADSTGTFSSSRISFYNQNLFGAVNE